MKRLIGKLQKTCIGRNMLKIFKCLQCGSIFDRPSQLKYHYRNKHLGEKSHVCQICEKAFFRKADLRMHLNIHLGTNFYICEVCGRKFNHISNLIRHCRIHTGIKPYVCPICDKRFTQISSLAKHKQIHTPKDFTQQYCNPSLINDKLQAKDCALNENEINNDIKNKNDEKLCTEQKCVDQNTARISDIQPNKIIFDKQTDIDDKVCLSLGTVVHVGSKQDHFTEIEERFKSINLSMNKTVVSNFPLDKTYNEQIQSKDLIYQFSKNFSTLLSRDGESNAKSNIHNDEDISRLNDSETYAVQETCKETSINSVKNLSNEETNLQICSQNFDEILTNKKFLPKQICKEIGENRKDNKLNNDNQLYFSDIEMLKSNESRYCHNTDFINVNINHTVKSQHSESIAATDALYTSIANEDQDNLLQHNEDILNNSNNAVNNLNNEEPMLRLVQTETGEQFYEYIINNLEKVQNVSCRKNLENATEEAANVLGDCEKINPNFKENNKKNDHIEHHQNLEDLTINNEFNYAQLESHGEEKNSSVLCHGEHFQNSQAYNFENLELLESHTDFDKYVETNFEALERLNYENYEKFLELEVSRIADIGVEFYKEPSMVRLVQNDGEQLLELLQDSQIIEQENQNFIQINNLNKDCLNVLQDSNKITDCSKSKSDFFTYVENNLSLEENVNNNQAVEDNEKYVNNGIQQLYRDIITNESVNNENCVRTSEKPKKKITSKRFCCSVCNKTFSTAYNYSQHIGIHFTDQQKFHCKDCGISFAWKSTLNKHILNNHSSDGPQKFICEICPKVYSTLSQVNEHVKRDHLKERNHVCQTCGKTFFKRFDLKIHSRTHTDERPYVCNVCNKGFHHQSHFIRHMRIHMGVKPYACNYCPKRFTQLSAFKQHCQKHPVHMDFTDYQIDREKDARTAAINL